MPLVSFSVACLSCLSFFSPLCRLTAHSLPSSWLRHGWPFLFLLYIPRVIKNEESRKEQEHYERSRSKRGRRRTVRIGRTSPHSLPNPGFTHFFLSICLFLTLTENWHSNCLFREWLDSFCVATCTCVSPSLLPLFVGIMPVSPAAQTRPNVLVFLTPISQIYTYILLLYSHTFPCHPSFSLLAPTFSFDTGARATTLDGSICPSVSVPHLSRNPRSFAFLSRCLLSFLSFHTIPFVRLYHIGRTWRICGKEGNNYHYE